MDGMRLLDCRSLMVVQAERTVQYLALSYVWGRERKGPIRKRNDCSLRLESLSQTIRDAITLTRSLQYGYIWIDKICIDQESSTERYKQIMQMDKIYAGAELTIIAAAGNDEEFGLPGVSISRQLGAAEVLDVGNVQIIP